MFDFTDQTLIGHAISENQLTIGKYLVRTHHSEKLDMKLL